MSTDTDWLAEADEATEHIDTALRDSLLAEYVTASADPAEPAPPPKKARSGGLFAKKDDEPVKPKKAPAREPVAKKGEFIQPLEDMYTTVALGVGLFDMQCAGAISDSAPACAKAWQDLAEKNPNVRRVLRQVTEGGAFAGLIIAHAPIIVAVASHHMPQLLPGKDKGDESTVSTDGGIDAPGDS